jgi:hypothetical protein
MLSYLGYAFAENCARLLWSSTLADLHLRIDLCRIGSRHPQTPLEQD